MAMLAICTMSLYTDEKGLLLMQQLSEVLRLFMTAR